MTREQLEKFIEAKAERQASRSKALGELGDELAFIEGANFLLPSLLTALAALEFYASAQPSDTGDKPFFRNEFGCKCCAGTNDANGDNDFDKSVVGLTAREALAEVAKELGGGDE